MTSTSTDPLKANWIPIQPTWLRSVACTTCTKTQLHRWNICVLVYTLLFHYYHKTEGRLNQHSKHFTILIYMIMDWGELTGKRTEREKGNKAQPSSHSLRPAQTQLLKTCSIWLSLQTCVCARAWARLRERFSWLAWMSAFFVNRRCRRQKQQWAMSNR